MHRQPGMQRGQLILVIKNRYLAVGGIGLDPANAGYGRKPASNSAAKVELPLILAISRLILPGRDWITSIPFRYPGSVRSFSFFP